MHHSACDGRRGRQQAPPTACTSPPGTAPASVGPFCACGYECRPPQREGLPGVSLCRCPAADADASLLPQMHYQSRSRRTSPQLWTCLDGCQPRHRRVGSPHAPWEGSGFLASSADQPHRIKTLSSKVKQTDNWTTVAGAARTCHGPEQDTAARPHPVPGVQLHRAEVRHTRKQLTGHKPQFMVSGGEVPPSSALLAANMSQRSVSSARRKQLLGGLKIGCKRLFLHSPESKQYLEMMPDCVLDFYVHESCQRASIGRTLLEVSLSTRTSGHSAVCLLSCIFWSAHTCACTGNFHADSAAL